MKSAKTFFILVILGVLASCQIHQGNFAKRKFLDLKKMNDEEVVETNNQKEQYFEGLSNNSNFQENNESSESSTNSESANVQSSCVEIIKDEIEQTIFGQNSNTEKSKNVIHQQHIIDTTNPADVTKKDNPKTADQLFKLASLIFLLGLLLILLALVGLLKSKMTEAAGFVSFMLGLIALIVSAIYAIVGSNKINPDKPRQSNIKRHDFVLFFTLFFVGLALLMIHGRV